MEGNFVESYIDTFFEITEMVLNEITKVGDTALS